MRGLCASTVADATWSRCSRSVEQDLKVVHMSDAEEVVDLLDEASDQSVSEGEPQDEGTAFLSRIVLLTCLCITNS